MRLKYFVFLFISLWCYVPSAFAYGSLGHYITGQVAQEHLSLSAKKRLTSLLNGSSLPMVSNWADFQKSNPMYDAMNDWHYLNLDSGLTRTQFDSLVYLTVHGQNVYQVKRLINLLRENPNDTTSLLFLIHLVEDMHCPMHFGRLSDRGGNDVPVFWFSSKINLHSLWDDTLIESQKLSYTEYASHLLTLANYPSEPFQMIMLTDWAWQNYQLAEDIYAQRQLLSSPYHYIYYFRDDLEEAMRNAGLHLAMILNSLYD